MIDWLTHRIARSTRAMRALQVIGLPPGQVRDAIILSGSPRSGTTWLAELLAALPEYTLVDEPLNLQWTAAKRAGFNEWRTYIPPSAVRPASHAYVEKALAGRVACTRQFSARTQLGKVRDLLVGRKNVVKFVRANRILHWMNHQFPVRGTILMLRHPCAVVASQLDYKRDGWKRTEPPPRDNLQTGFGGWIPDDVFERFKPVLANVHSTAGRLAAVWCLDTYFPLLERDSFPGLITTYERLLTQEADEVKRIFQWLEAPVPGEALQSFDDASHSASSDLVTEDVQRQLSKWQDKLSPAQIDDVLSVLEGFGLDFYTDALEPDYADLFSLSNGSHASAASVL